MDAIPFEQTLEAADLLAQAYQRHVAAQAAQDAADERLIEADSAYKQAVKACQEASRSYDEAKLALIASVEAL